MTYQEIQAQLKEFKAQGYENIPALNSKKEVLQAALDQILATIAPSEEIAEVVTETVEIIEPAKELDFTPAHSIWSLPNFTLNIRAIEIAAYAIALIKFLGVKLTPYLKKGLNTALRIAVTTAVIFQEWILPKIMIRLYLIGIWGVTIALKIVQGRRGMSIA